ncbi:MAG: hypothetical protein ACQESP_12480 [Candidatus Muiribacteriota bacterium]
MIRVTEFLKKKKIYKRSAKNSNFTTYYHAMLKLIIISGLKNEFDAYEEKDLEFLFEHIKKIENYFKEEK